MSADSSHTVIAYHIGSLGDAIVTMPALAVARRRYAAARLVLLSNAHRHGRAPVAARTALEGSGLVDDFVTYEGDARPRDLPAMLVRTSRPTMCGGRSRAVASSLHDCPTWRPDGIACAC